MFMLRFRPAKKAVLQRHALGVPHVAGAAAACQPACAASAVHRLVVACCVQYVYSPVPASKTAFAAIVAKAFGAAVTATAAVVPVSAALMTVAAVTLLHALLNQPQPCCQRDPPACGGAASAAASCVVTALAGTMLLVSAFSMHDCCAATGAAVHV